MTKVLKIAGGEEILSSLDLDAEQREIARGERESRRREDFNVSS